MMRIIGVKWCVKMYFEPRDLWIGVFVKSAKRIPGIDVYICPLPCLVIRVFQYIPFAPKENVAL